MRRLAITSLGLLVWVTLGCEAPRSREPVPQAGQRGPVREVIVDLACPGEPRRLSLQGDVILDDELCGARWGALQIEAATRTDVLRQVPGREVRLRRTRDAAFVEVRAANAVTMTIPQVRAIRWLSDETPPPRVDGIEVAHGGKIERLSERDLKHRYAGERSPSLCRLADDFGLRPGGSISVFGEQDAPLQFSRESCELEGLVLQVSGKGGVRLRGAGKKRFLRSVRRVEL